MSAAQSPHRIVAAGAIGNVLEWFDFALYGYFAPILGRLFFPHQDAVAQLLSTFGIFAIGFVVRPFGGALMGYIGDRYGRRNALTISVAAMAVPTFLLGLLPGYGTLGLAAPILLTVLRIIQGLSVGGECTTSIVFLVEHAPEGRRGLMGAMSIAGAQFGMVLGSASGALLSAVLSADAMESWGWRMPFLLGLLVGVAGYYVRRGIPETPRRTTVRSPLVEAFSNHTPLLLRIFSLSLLNCVGFFIVFVYIVSWLQRAEGVSLGRALTLNSISMLVMITTMLVMAWLSDRIGRRPILMAAAAVSFVGALPFFWLTHHSNSALILFGQLGFALALGMAWGAMPSAMVEAAPPGVRCSVVAVAFNVTMGVVGGMMPFIATWLVARTHGDLSPAFLIMGAAVVTFLSAASVTETYRARLAVA